MTDSAPGRWALAIHGGAGARPRHLPLGELRAVREALRGALEAGVEILCGGGRGLDAVQAAVRVMEGSGAFNAGCGAVLNHEGFAELDAALMDGRGRRAGAVAALRHIAHPIDLARAVMEQGRHVMLAGEGAERFAVERGFALEADGCFVTARRLQELAHVKAAAARAKDAAGQAESPAGQGDSPADTADDRAHIPWHPLGTVGAVALDAHGDLAAATSTGGLTNKHAGRVGDSPIIGAGTFAENGVCAVSGTGAGEFFMRFTAASEVAARVRFQGRSIETAAHEVLDMMKAAGGEGGLIVIDADGRIAMPFSSQTMLRACAASERAAEVTVESGA